MSSGYDFIPLPQRVIRRARGTTLAEKLAGRLFGRIELAYRTIDPVHVGAGVKGLRDNRAVRLSVRAGDKPAVPGSSMKGCLRARYEAITRSCALWAPKDQKKITSQTYPGARAEMSEAVKRHEVFASCDMQKQCAACALFGFQHGRNGMRSRITVEDMIFDVALEVAKMPEQYGPRNHHLGRFDVRGGAGAKTLVVQELYGRKFYGGRSSAEVVQELGVEVLPARALGVGRVRLFNVEAAELGGLLAAMGRNPSSVLKIGAGKNLRFGRIALESIRFQLEDDRGVRVEVDEERMRAAFIAGEDYDADAERELVAIHGGRR